MDDYLKRKNRPQNINPLKESEFESAIRESRQEIEQLISKLNQIDERSEQIRNRLASTKFQTIEGENKVQGELLGNASSDRSSLKNSISDWKTQETNKTVQEPAKLGLTEAMVVEGITEPNRREGNAPITNQLPQPSKRVGRKRLAR